MAASNLAPDPLADAPLALLERNKTPPLAQVSMTPPPSSQPVSISQPVARTPTPHSHLSSPPPTNRAPQVGMMQQSNGLEPYEQDQIDAADSENLRKMLHSTNAAHREAKASAASLKLQYNLLLMETSEAMKRKDVELDMALKEVEVARLQPQRASSATPVISQAQLQTSHMAAAQAQYSASLKDRVHELEMENANIRIRYDDLRSTMRDREAALYEEIARLRERIRSNRKHLNLLRSSSVASDGSPFSAFSTPVAPGRMAGRGEPTRAVKALDGDAFSQLLLADQVLSQEVITTPSTPQPRRGLGHHRGVQSLSSLPSTPAQAQSVPKAFRSRQQYFTPRDGPSPPVPQTAPVKRFATRRRQSRDSTISASDGEDQVGEEDLTDREDVPESQASQEARRMLSKSGSFGRSAASSQHSNAAAHTSGLFQAKLYGPISKPHTAGKRKASSEMSAANSKKGRQGKAIGLGIGGWASPGK